MRALDPTTLPTISKLVFDLCLCLEPILHWITVHEATLLRAVIRRLRNQPVSLVRRDVRAPRADGLALNGLSTNRGLFGLFGIRLLACGSHFTATHDLSPRC